jgi:acyl carrier protein
VTSVPSRTEILGDIIAILSDQIGVPFSSDLDEKTRLFADLGLASIDAVVLSETLQKHYDRPLPFNELMAEVGRKSERDLSIGELIAFLTKHL